MVADREKSSVSKASPSWEQNLESMKLPSAPELRSAWAMVGDGEPSDTVKEKRDLFNTVELELTSFLAPTGELSFLGELDIA